jgi:hypothetical protein
LCLQYTMYGIVLHCVRQCVQCGSVYSAAVCTVLQCVQCCSVYSAAVRTVLQCVQCGSVYSAAVCTVQHCVQCSTTNITECRVNYCYITIVMYFYVKLSVNHKLYTR